METRMTQFELDEWDCKGKAKLQQKIAVSGNWMADRQFSAISSS